MYRIIKGPRTWKTRLLEWADMQRRIRIDVPLLVQELAAACDIAIVPEGGTHRRIIAWASRRNLPVVIWCAPPSLHGNAKFALVSATSAYGVLLRQGMTVKLLFGFDDIKRKIREVRAWLRTS